MSSILVKIITSILGNLDGYKSYLGAGVMAVAVFLQYMGGVDPQVIEFVRNLGMAILGIGLAHKLAKVEGAKTLFLAFGVGALLCLSGCGAKDVQRGCKCVPVDGAPNDACKCGPCCCCEPGNKCSFYCKCDKRAEPKPCCPKEPAKPTKKGTTGDLP